MLVLENRIVWAAFVGCSVPLTRSLSSRKAGRRGECSGRGAIGLVTRTMVALASEEGATASKDAPLRRGGRSGFRRSRICGMRYDGRLLDACPAGSLTGFVRARVLAEPVNCARRLRARGAEADHGWESDERCR